MDRYKRDQAQALRKADPSYHNLDMYRQQSSQKLKDPYRQYIPMSQHGERKIQEEYYKYDPVRLPKNRMLSGNPEYYGR
jgi:hypothetical protein